MTEKEFFEMKRERTYQCSSSEALRDILCFCSPEKALEYDREFCEEALADARKCRDAAVRDRFNKMEISLGDYIHAEIVYKSLCVDFGLAYEPVHCKDRFYLRAVPGKKRL